MSFAVCSLALSEGQFTLQLHVCTIQIGDLLHQVGLVLSESIPPTITTEPPSYQMHLWNGSSFVTHTNPFVWDGPAIKLGEGIKDWDAAIARLRVRKQHLKASVKL